MGLEGKGIFIWKIKDCEGGDPEAIAETADQAGFTHVLIKIADGAYSYNYDWRSKIDEVPPLVEALLSRGISPWGWHYVRGDAPAAEARKAVERVKELGLDGYVIDAEHEYKGRHKEAALYMKILRQELPNTPLALASYRYPSYHPTLPWRNFLAKCDLVMPQMYWQGSSNPKWQLNKCLGEYKELAPALPVIPIGAAYTEHNWTPKSTEIIDFLDESRAKNLTAANFWEWAASKRAGLWDTLTSYSWNVDQPPAPTPPQPTPPSPTPPPPAPGPPPAAPDVPDIVEQYFMAINARNLNQIMRLFKPDAIHVDSAQVIQGTNKISEWYLNLLTNVLPQAQFRLHSSTGNKIVVRFSWSATTPGGTRYDGQDVFGLFDGQIGFHSTKITKH